MKLLVDEVEFSYHSRPVLRRIKFAVKKGDFCAVLGNNGAGKSTLLKCLNKILQPQAGVIFLGKDELSKLSRQEMAQRVGYVAQRYQNPRFTVFDAVLMGRKPRIKWSATSKDLEAVQSILELLGLSEFSLRYLDELSGGELQKVVLARALVQEPRVFLLDEPTSNLDLRNQFEVLQIVKSATREHRLASVVALHDLNLALRFADQFLLLKDGRIFACGGKEIMTPENITSIYGVPVAVERVRGIPVVMPL